MAASSPPAWIGPPNFGAGDYAKGVYLRSASDNVISGNTLYSSVVNLWL